MGHLKILFSAAIVLLATSAARSEENAVPRGNDPTTSSDVSPAGPIVQLVQTEPREGGDAARESTVAASATLRPTSEDQRAAIAVEKARAAYFLALERQRHAKVVVAKRRREASAPRVVNARPHKPYVAPSERPELVVAQQQGGCRTINCPRYVLLGVGF